MLGRTTIFATQATGRIGLYENFPSPLLVFTFWPRTQMTVFVAFHCFRAISETARVSKSSQENKNIVLFSNHVRRSACAWIQATLTRQR